MSTVNSVRPNVAGLPWQARPDATRTRPTTTAVDVVDRDEYVPGTGVAASNPYGKVRDRLRTAALKRDAAATATSETEDAKSSADDNAIAHDKRR